MAQLSPNNAAPLYQHGINYHATTTIRQERNIYGTGFRCDAITSEQRDWLMSHENVEIVVSGPLYAPEIRKPLIVIKTAAQMRRERSN